MRYRIEYADGRCCNFANSRKDLFSFFQNHLTFSAFPCVISMKNKFFCESTVQTLSETCY